MNKLFNFFIKYFSILVKVILVTIAYLAFRKNGISSYDLIYAPCINLFWLLAYRFYQKYFLKFVGFKKTFLFIIDILFDFIMFLSILLRISNVIFIEFVIVIMEIVITHNAEKEINLNKNIKDVIAFIIFIHLGLISMSGVFRLEEYKYLFYFENIVFGVFVINLSTGIFILIEYKSEGNIKISLKKKILMYILYFIASCALSIGILIPHYKNHELSGISINGDVFYYLVFAIYPISIFRMNCYFAECGYRERHNKTKENINENEGIIK